MRSTSRSSATSRRCCGVTALCALDAAEALSWPVRMQMEALADTISNLHAVANGAAELDTVKAANHALQVRISQLEGQVYH